MMLLFAAWLASDFVPTLYKLKLRPGLTIPPRSPLLVTCVMLMMYRTPGPLDEQHVLFHYTHPDVVSL